MQLKEPITKTKLPIKTKIAVWWLCILGLLLTIAIIALLPAMTDFSYINPAANWIIIAAGLVLFFSPAVLICLKKELTRFFAIVILISGIGFFFVMIGINPVYGLLFSPGILVILVPFILLILDRKNYFEMVRQRELEKKDE